ncbi:MAG: apolipoprotein N-acyltransferase [Candidatus Marinimicrobia bacterium]|nr:apolipoprotein N-acyltransferase [Candidatus Neomarinimicrobiota bacterium]|tara:strand:- start:947 stop:2449 length:1503 start_codon:yes stop_codon:yes gene_type:complete
MKSFNRLYNIVISASLMGLAQLPLDLGWLSWFCLVPFFIAIKDRHSLKGICIDAFIWGFIYHLISLFWLVDNIGVPNRYIALTTMLLTNFVCTFNVILIFIFWHFINKKNSYKVWYALPVVWTVIDFVRSFGSISFPWASIANTQAQPSLLFLIQFIEITGMFGLTIWIVLLNVSLFYIYTNRDKKSVIDSIGIFVTPIVLSVLLINKNIDNIEKIDFAILQPNMSIYDKNNTKSSRVIDDLLKKSKKYIDEYSSHRILIWPETAFNHFNKNSYNQFKRKLFDSDIELITGVFEIDNGLIYNSVYLLNQKNSYVLNNAKKYTKIKMVPLAEHVPMSDFFPSLNRIALSGNFEIGNEYTLFDYKNSKYAAMICIESTYSALSRNFVRKGANFLIYVANDGWYLKPPQAQQHAKQTIFRAIETRKPVIRCGNTGISWVVNSDGNILKELSQNKEGMLVSSGFDIYSNDLKTIYVIFGDWIGYLSILIAIYLSTVGVVNKRNG